MDFFLPFFTVAATTPDRLKKAFTYFHENKMPLFLNIYLL